MKHSPVFTATLIIARLAGAGSSSRDTAGNAQATVEDPGLSNGIDTTALPREVEVKDVEPVDVDSDELRPLVNPGLSIFGRGLDQDTIEAVLNGLRSGPLDAFPTGSYDIDDGADTVFRTADGEVSLDYTTVRDAPCSTLRGPGWLFGDCARSRAPTGGAVVLQRYAPIRPDGTIDTVIE